MSAANRQTCECGERATRLVEEIPEADRASHQAAGNSGTWPANGADRTWYCEGCAEAVVREAEGWAEIVETIELECECECGCGEAATTRDEGSYLCGACAEYAVDESGECHCSREYDGETCPHCGAAIAWGPIQTHGPGEANDRAGACPCGRWYQADRGGWGVPSYESKYEEEEGQ